MYLLYQLSPIWQYLSKKYLLLWQSSSAISSSISFPRKKLKTLLFNNSLSARRMVESFTDIAISIPFNINYICGLPCSPTRTEYWSRNRLYKRDTNYYIIGTNNTQKCSEWPINSYWPFTIEFVFFFQIGHQRRSY